MADKHKGRDKYRESDAARKTDRQMNETDIRDKQEGGERPWGKWGRGLRAFVFDGDTVTLICGVPGVGVATTRLGCGAPFVAVASATQRDL